MQNIERKPWLRRRARGASALGLLGLFVAAGCSDEVGGDGFVPDRPVSAGKAGGGSAGSDMQAGGMQAGGTVDDGGAPTDMSASGTGGRSHGGSAGKSSGGTAGTAGTVTMDGGAGGDTNTVKSVCGNGAVEPGEQCDDGNTKSGDGCTADCLSDCEVCEKTFCKAVHSYDAGEFNWTADGKKNPYDPFSNCYAMPDIKHGGLAPDVPQAELCRAAMDCARQQQCAQAVPDNPPPPARGGSSTLSFLRCFCDYDVTAVTPSFSSACSIHENFSSDPQHMPNYTGKCHREFLEASEYDTEDQVSGAYDNPNRPFGAAAQLLSLCDRALCTEECLPHASTGVVAQISADILQTKNEAGESPLGDLIADGQRAATNTDFALVNDGSFFSDYASMGLIFHAAPGRAADAEGRVLQSEVRQALFGMLPTTKGLNVGGGTLLVTMQLTGQQIYDLLTAQSSTNATSGTFLQVSGLAFSLDATTHAVVEVRKGGSPIDKAAIYTVTLNNSLLVLVTGAKNVVTTDQTPEQALVKYLKAQTQVIAPPALNRITLVN